MVFIFIQWRIRLLGIYEYVLSPKIPYAYSESIAGKEWIVNFSLGNYVKLYSPDGIIYEGEFTKDSIDHNDVTSEYNSLLSIFGDTRLLLDNISQITTDMSLMMYAYEERHGRNTVPQFLSPRIADGEVSMLDDYSIEKRDDANYTPSRNDDVSTFHIKRRKVIIDLITKTLNEKINNHNRYADMMGITYDFYLPEITHDNWINSINDISIMAFVQGIPTGQKTYYNSYALRSFTNN